MKPKKKIVDLGNKLNPLVLADSLKVSVSTVTNNKLLTFDGEDYLPSEYTLGRDEYTKLYTSSQNRKLITALGNSAKSLFLFVLYSLQSGQDWLKINRDRYMAENSVGSINTYKSALSELLKANILREVEGHKGHYWINPRLFFCGSRINKYPDNVVVYQPKKKTD